MKITLSEYVANTLAAYGIKDVFTVVGGGSIYLNDALGHHPTLHCVYNHHEQASSIAAEAYYRVHNKLAVCCVTGGPGAINALNGVIGAFLDSIPMIVLSGQTKTELMSRYTELPIRSLGNQEYDIVSTLQNATKYAVTIRDPRTIRYELEKSLYIATNGRPGPAWIEIPIDVQSQLIDTDSLNSYIPDIKPDISDQLSESVRIVLRKLCAANRPVVYAGNGIRLSGAHKFFLSLVKLLNIPVVTGWDSIDLIDSDNPLYVGRAGTMGDRPGNFAVQNSDFILSIGNRLGIYQTGYNKNLWARAAYVVAVDIDSVEMMKPTVHIDIPICADAGLFIQEIFNQCKEIGFKFINNSWLTQCQKWKFRYPVVDESKRTQKTPLNVYGFLDYLSKSLPDSSITVVANGSASVVGSAVYYIRNNSRFIMNCALSSMGYDLPAAIGACLANNNKSVICISGDGSIMMNIQELQTIATNKLPIKIVIINNQGYHQIRLTQNNLFDGRHIGIGPESQDIDFPDFADVARTFGLNYLLCDNIESLPDIIDSFLSCESAVILNAICDTKQIFEPKSSVKQLSDGSLVSPPLEDLAPFLPLEELKANMYIDLVET